LAATVAAESLIEAAFPEIAVESGDFLSDLASLRIRIDKIGISTDRLKVRLEGVPPGNAKPAEFGPDSGVR
jgi:hypothetical protein